MAVVQTKTYTAATSASNAVTFDSAATAGNLLWLAIAADDYMATPPSGWTMVLGTKADAEDFVGVYLIYKVAAGGETGVTYVIGSGTASAAYFEEHSGMATVSVLDVADGNVDQTDPINCGPITITNANDLLVAVAGTSSNAVALTLAGFSNSFSTRADLDAVNGSTHVGLNVATLTVAATGTYSTAADQDSSGSGNNCAILAAFKIGGGGGGGKVSKNTRSAPLGIEIGMNWQAA